MALEHRHRRPVDFTAALFALALLALLLFARGQELSRLTSHAADWASIIVIILGFFGLGLLLHALDHAARRFLRRALH